MATTLKVLIWIIRPITVIVKIRSPTHVIIVGVSVGTIGGYPSVLRVPLKTDLDVLGFGARLAISWKALFTRAGKRPCCIGTGGVGMAIVKVRVRTFVDVVAVDPVTTVAHIAVTLKTTHGIGATGVGVAVIEALIGTFINVLAVVGRALIAFGANALGTETNR
jgi:hypothetical protein